MTIADSRAVAWQWHDDDSQIIPSKEKQRRAAVDDSFARWYNRALVPLSLLAEAEELAERNRNHWHAMKAERDALQARLDGVVGGDLKAAYELLWSHTSVGTYGRQCIEALRDIAHPEEAAARAAARKEYCPYCFSWVGGPLICCENGYTNPKKLDRLTKSEAEKLRSAALGGESRGNGEDGK